MGCQRALTELEFYLIGRRVHVRKHTIGYYFSHFDFVEALRVIFYKAAFSVTTIYSYPLWKNATYFLPSHGPH
jgi:hypothetical protein